MPLKGTSLHNVGPSPRHSERTPRWATSARTDARVDLKVCGLSEDRGVDCRLVLNSSRGEMMDVNVVRAVIPATIGASEGGINVTAGKTCLSKWS